MPDKELEKVRIYERQLDELTTFIRNYCRDGEMSFEVLRAFLDYQVCAKVSITGHDSLNELGWLRSDFSTAIAEWNK